MAEHANSTPAPADERRLSVWWIRGLLDFARASTIAVDSEEGVEALCAIEGQLWRRLAAAPIKGPNDARGKLEAVLDDLILRRDIDHVSAGVVRDVIEWLDGVVLS
jgi:hypothetical protein